MTAKAKLSIIDDVRYHDPVNKRGRIEPRHAAMNRDVYNKYSSQWKHPWFKDKDLGGTRKTVAAGRHAHPDADWSAGAKVGNVPKDPNPMTRFGVGYQQLPEYTQFLATEGIGNKLKFLGKRAAVYTFKAAGPAAIVGGVSGGVSSTLNKQVYDAQQAKSQGVLAQLDALKKSFESLRLTGGTSYSSLHDRGVGSVSYNPVIGDVAEPTT